MKISSISIVAFSIVCLATAASGQSKAGKVENDQVQSGEAGYKVGCSAAASLNIPACGELPSGKKATESDATKKKASEPNATNKNTGTSENSKSTKESSKTSCGSNCGSVR